MRFGITKILIILMLALVVSGLFTQPAVAVWQTLLDEHFEEDQRNPNLKWPWFTDLRGNDLRRWHWNPYPPHFRAEQNYTRYCWGLQDFIYNRYVTLEDEQSIWCAYTNYTDVNNPRWPEDDDYMHDQNAWMCWGPIDLSEAENCMVSFWTYVHLSIWANDSLSVGVINDPNVWTSNDEDFRQGFGFGRTFSAGLHDWQQHRFSLDSLLVNGDSTSFIGDTVYVCFVWQSDNRAITGRGAFIDDVVVTWDDGLFDIASYRQYIGYPEEPDTVVWSLVEPRVGNQVYWRMDWRVVGEGVTPEFTIECYIDDELFYSENRSEQGNTDSTFSSITDELWTVTEGYHVIRWELDAPTETGGVVEETREENNIHEYEFEVIWNPPPMFQLTAPDVDSTIIRGDETASISWTISDSNDFDNAFTIYFYATTDTAGLAENPEQIFVEPFFYVDSRFAVPRGEGSLEWNMAQSMRESMVELNVPYYIAAFAVDSDPANMVTTVAPGSFILMAEGVEDHAVIPATSGLLESYPNPFNRSVTIEYGLKNTEDAKLAIFDLTGRYITTLAEGNLSAGLHKAVWNPSSISAGVYMVRLETSSEVFHRKLVYTP